MKINQTGGRHHGHRNLPGTTTALLNFILSRGWVANKDFAKAVVA
jgi:hypothetical protein